MDYAVLDNAYDFQRFDLAILDPNDRAFIVRRLYGSGHAVEPVVRGAVLCGGLRGHPEKTAERNASRRDPVPSG